MASTPTNDGSVKIPVTRPVIVRSHSEGGRSLRQERLKPRHNVKFTVGNESAEDQDILPPTPPQHRLSVPELVLPETDITESPTPPDNDSWRQRKEDAALTAHSKASRHADRVKKQVAPSSRRNSVDNIKSAPASPYASPIQRPASKIRLDDIPLTDLGKAHHDVNDNTTDEDSDDDADDGDDKIKSLQRKDTEHFTEARRLMKTFTSAAGELLSGPQNNQSGSQTPLIDQYSHEYEYVPKPEAYQRSVLSHLLAAQNEAASRHSQSSQTAQQQQIEYIAERLKPFAGPQDPRRQQPDFFQQRKELPRSPASLSGTQSPLNGSGESSGAMTPRSKRPKWYKDKQGRWQQNRAPNSSASLGQLLESSLSTATGVVTPDAASTIRKSPTQKRLSALDFMKHPVTHIRNMSSSSLPSLGGSTIVNHQMVGIADRLESQAYIIEMCKALMAYGAPTHRLEEFLSMAARKLCIQASFQYLPGCMIVSFDDPDTHTTELKLIREATAVDLGKLMEVQQVYKDVMHDQYSLMEAMDDLREIRNRRKRYGQPLLVLMYGIAAVSVGPFAFGARPIDFPISFILGCILGGLQLGLASRSSQFSHIFEVFGTFVTSFAARGFGSIMWHGESLFCFSSLAQSSIALILPGWIILSASLELQSRNIIAGSIRMVYAIIYTLFLGFGILIGTTIMGLLYSDATNDIQCRMPSYWTGDLDWTLIYTKFIWVPIFTVCLAMINQAEFKQMPMMIVISACGYQVNFWSAQRFSQNIQVANALGAFVIGVLANGYSRFRHGVAAAAMLPAIFVMVPSGLAASGSLIAGLTSANQITHNATGVSIINNGAQGFFDAQNNGTTTGDDSLYGGTIFNVGYGMVQVAIGISVGLFLSALIIYPFGKKRSGIFSF